MSAQALPEELANAIYSKNQKMDYSKDTETLFTVHPNGNGEHKEEVKEAPKEKHLSEAEVQELIKSMRDQFGEAKEMVISGGYSISSFIGALETAHKAFADYLNDLKLENNYKAAPEKAAAPAEKKKEESAAEDDPKKHFYDFEANPPLKCMFLGEGKTLKIKNKEVPTWKVQEVSDENKEFLLPKWKMFSEEQGNFFGFPKETPGKYVYLITYKGLHEENRTYQFEILKKLPM